MKRLSKLAFKSLLKQLTGLNQLGETALIAMACWVLMVELMIIEVTYSDSQEFDDNRFFQRLTLIDICWGPPAIA